MLAWLLSGDDDIEEIDVDIDRALLLPDDKLVRIVGLIGELMGETQCFKTASTQASDDVAS
jgi:hypothetical protein